jgi:hypothetical protein
MPFPSFGFYGQAMQTEQVTTQYVIPSGGGATFSNANSTTSGMGLCTFTTNAAHGLTMVYTSGTMPNYFVTFGGSTSASTGTGILVGNIFRIISIPSTTTFTFFSTITTMTVTSATVIPVFFAPFQASAFTTGAQGIPTQTISSVVTPEAWPQVGQASVCCTLGANCNVYYFPDNTMVPLDAATGPTPATAPVKRTLIAASSQGQWIGNSAQFAVWANGTTATSDFSVLN